MQDEDLPTDYEGIVSAYKKLKEEFDDQNQVYEDYISSLEKTKKELEGKLTQKDKEQEVYKKEISKLKEANIDRNKDIEYLENEIAKHEAAKKQLKEKLTKQENKSVEVELENTYYFNKVRELECWAEELKSKLDDALEENVIVNSEYEAFKAECDEKIQRIQEELEDNKNEVLSKEKMIQKLTSHRDFLIRTNSRKSEDKFVKKNTVGATITHESLDKIEGVNSSNPSIQNIRSTQQKTIHDNKQQIKMTIPEKFITQLSQSLSNLALHKSDTLEGIEGLEIGDHNPSEPKTSNEHEYLIQKLQNEVKNILENRKTYLLTSLSEESFAFDVINIEGPNKLGKIKTAVQVNEAIDEVLMKIRERKDKVITQKRLLQAKFEKLGIKIN